MKKSNILKVSLIIFIFTSCSTLKKTIVYSGSAGILGGAFVGRSLSPDQESKTFNTVLGAVTGAALTAAVGYFFWKDANPDLKLKNPVLPPRANPLPILADPLLSGGGVNFPQNLTPIGDKQYIKLKDEIPSDIKKHSKKQYYRRYKTIEKKYEKGNRVFVIPPYEIIENGVE